MTIQKAVILNSSSWHSLMKNLQLPFFVASSYEGKTKDKEDPSMDNALGSQSDDAPPTNEDFSSPKSEIGDCKGMVKGL